MLFAWDYLTWDAAKPRVHERALEPFVGQAMEAGAGLELPARGSERVEWTQVVQEAEPFPGEHIYTVAAQTDPSGLLYLSVSVKQTPAGELALAGYPGFVGGPASRPAAVDGGGLLPVGQAGLWTVVARALASYLAGSERGLEAQLAPGVRVSVPTLGLSLLSLRSLRWGPAGGSVLAEVLARDRSGARYRLGYELDAVEQAGRWQISGIQANPDH